MNIETIEKLKKCCEREAQLRKNVYPKWVASGKMTQEEADNEIRLMFLAAACFNKILKGEAKEVQNKLFNTQDYEIRKYDIY